MMGELGTHAALQTFAGPALVHGAACQQLNQLHSSDASPLCAGAVELGKIRADTTLVLQPSVFLANALAAFALNLVRVVQQMLDVCSWPCKPPQSRAVLQAVFMLIGKTSALTMNIAGVIKDWLLIFLSFYLFKAPVTALNLFGYFFCCSGVSRPWFLHPEAAGCKPRA